jgi:hypothetical protein
MGSVVMGRGIAFWDSVRQPKWQDFEGVSSRQADSTCAKKALRTGAADLTFLHRLPRVRARNVKSTSGTRAIILARALCFPKFV